ncbi:MAG: hypothetical protein R2806_22880 [Saprospiraceae bacterium]
MLRFSSPFVFILLTLALPAQTIEVKLSPVMGMLNLLETLQGATGTSVTLRKQAEQQLPDEVRATLLNDYQQLRTEYQFIREGYPSARKVILSTRKLLMLAAAQATDLTDFQTRITGILPNQDMISLIDILGRLEPYYQKLFWNPNHESLASLQKQMTEEIPEILPLFKKAKTFYGTPWPASLPFIVNLYPIPALEGHTAATPYGNVLVCGYLTRHPQALEQLKGIVIHEMCHILYEEQTQAMQNDLDDWFKKDDSPFRPFAYSYLDEGLATAIGNGWGEEILNGKLDTGQWYDDPYIDTYAKSLYPEVKSYLDHHKTIDQAFVVKAVAAFAKSFPDALFSFENLLNEVNIYTEEEDPVRIQQIITTIRTSFTVRNSWVSSPIASDQSLERMKNGPATHLILVDRNHQAILSKINQNIESLRTVLNGLRISGETIITHVDADTGNTYIICILFNEESLPRAMEALQAAKNLDLNQSVIPIK